jgi:VWFA-related protein
MALEMMPPSSVEGRRVVLLISDGVDTSSGVKLEKAIADIVRAGAVVYVVGVGEEDWAGIDEEALRKLASRTGGRAFFPKKPKDLPAVLARVRDELLSQYLLTFEAPAVSNSVELQKVKVEVVNPELRKRDLRLAYPQGFYAGSGSGAGGR